MFTSVFGLGLPKISCTFWSLIDGEKRKDVIFYNCSGPNGRDASENVRNSVNKLDGEAWVICSKKEKKKDSDEEKVAENNDVAQV